MVTPDDSSEPFFLFVTGFPPDGAVSRLRTSGVYYIHKKLESTPENWEVILELIQSPRLLGVVARLTSPNFAAITRREYESVASRFVAALAATKHVLFVHEAILAADTQPAVTDEPSSAEDNVWTLAYSDPYFEPPPRHVRDAVLGLLAAHRINVVPYATNAELSVLSGIFVEDSEKNLLFRVYVPAGRLYGTEAERLLSLFRGWLTQVKGQRVRQDAHRTRNGEIY